MTPVESLPTVGLKFQASSFGPRLYLVFPKLGGAAGAVTTLIDDISCCGEPDLLLRVRCILEKRSDRLVVPGKSFVHVGMELGQQQDFSMTLTQGDPTNHPKPLLLHFLLNAS